MNTEIIKLILNIILNIYIGYQRILKINIEIFVKCLTMFLKLVLKSKKTKSPKKRSVKKSRELETALKKSLIKLF